MTTWTDSFGEVTSWMNLFKETTTWADSFAEITGWKNSFWEATVEVDGGVSNSRQPPPIAELDEI